MLKITYKCNNCGCTRARVFAHDRDVVAECVDCNGWEILPDNYPEPNTHKENEHA